MIFSSCNIRNQLLSNDYFNIKKYITFFYLNIQLTSQNALRPFNKHVAFC